MNLFVIFCFYVMNPRVHIVKCFIFKWLFSWTKILINKNKKITLFYIFVFRLCQNFLFFIKIHFNKMFLIFINRFYVVHLFIKYYLVVRTFRNSIFRTSFDIECCNKNRIELFFKLAGEISFFKLVRFSNLFCNLCHNQYLPYQRLFHS